MEHELKCHPPYFDAIKRGEKPFEVRRDDRGFQKGDHLQLRRFDPDTRNYTGERLYLRVTYVLTDGHPGIVPGYVVMGLAEIPS
jgi:ASC-1-like (ASCH) protein